jgi:hypothetical protein
MIPHDQLVEMTEKIKAVSVYMTCKDMEEEYGWKASTIRQICRDNNIHIVSPKQINLNYIKEMANRKTKEQIKKALKIGDGQLCVLAKEAGVTLKDEVEKPFKTTSELKRLARIRELIIDEYLPHAHDTTIKAEYTQGSSPFKLADELKGIITK